MVQAYRVGLDYGFVSERVAGLSRPMTGVRINLDKSSYRVNAESRDRDGEGEMMFREYKTGVEEELERIFERIVEQFRDRSHHSGRYKRETEHDLESRRRKSFSSSRRHGYDRRQ